MSDSAHDIDRLLDLADAVYDETASENEFAEMDTLLIGDDESRSRYLSYCWMHTAIKLELRANRAAKRLQRQIDRGIHASGACEALELARPSALPIGVVRNTFHGATGYFSSGWPVAYLIATVIFGIGLAIGAFTHVSELIPVAHDAPLQPGGTAQSIPTLTEDTVGRITGMVDCRWSHPRAATFNGASVPLGRSYVLDSGLMEITYDSGAKVILQGPVTYEVESAAGGYLLIGKLTAKLEKTSEVRGPRSESASQESKIINQTFVVRTPTATVTDLGTEFGVEVDKQGVTTSHVYRGLVRMNVVADSGEPEGAGQLLHENESARVDPRTQRPMTVVPADNRVDFVRDIPKSTIKVFDLVDVVAGGDGFSGRRNAGIDATTGKPSNTPPKPENFFITGDHKYHRVAGLPFVDGVFIPDGSRGPVQVDSGGHVCSSFTKTANLTAGYIWTGGPIPVDKREYHIPTTLSGVDYASPGHGLLFMHANKGITFDLDAIRRANHGWNPSRFRTVAGNLIGESMMPLGLVDFWVIVDGQVRFQRRAVNGYSGAFVINLRIGENDRFLTLAATDNTSNTDPSNTDPSNGIGGDWTMFGDPRIELAPVHSTTCPALLGTH